MTEGDDTDGVGRRRFLRTAAGATTAAGVTGSAAAQEGGGSGGGSTTVQVGPGGQLIFTPSEVQIQPGGTVKWVWESGGHNVVTESGGGGWSGHEPLENAGFTLEHTFQEATTVEYVCEPHASAGMTGTVIVGSGGGGPQTALPSSAKSLGVAAVAAMTSTLGLAYFFIKYGGDYDVPEE